MHSAGHYADRFAERADQTRKLIWDDVPIGMVIRGIMDRQSGEPLIKIVTRASTPEELQKYQHPRMPLLESRYLLLQTYWIYRSCFGLTPALTADPPSEPLRLGMRERRPFS